MAIVFKSKEKFLLIDTSYVFHARISSSFKTYMETFHDLPYPKEYIHTYDWTTNEEFMSILKQSAANTFKYLMAKYKVSPQNTILAVDCSRKDIWRKKIYQEYKDNRDVTPEEQEGEPNFAQVWVYIRSQLLFDICSKQGCKLVKNKYCEGDDIIAIATSFIRENYGTDAKITIFASDSDLTQLYDGDNFIIEDLMGENVVEKTKAKYNIDDLSHLMKIKELSGDKKDNVPQAFKGIGPVKALKMINDKDFYDKTEKLNPNGEVIRKKNRVLLDFNCIPLPIKESVKQELKQIYKIESTGDLDGI